VKQPSRFTKVIPAVGEIYPENLTLIIDQMSEFFLVRAPNLMWDATYYLPIHRIDDLILIIRE